jgi:quercetin dioxygenase-like cupin family protein
VASFDLGDRPVHLGLGATAVIQPPMDGGMAWYESYERRHGNDGTEGRLVSLYTFDAPWTSWEMHPAGEELVVVMAGELTLVQELDGAPVRIALRAGQAAINPRGVWHTADAAAPATVLFITAGVGTEHRPR